MWVSLVLLALANCSSLVPPKPLVLRAVRQRISLPFLKLSIEKRSIISRPSSASAPTEDVQQCCVSSVNVRLQFETLRAKRTQAVFRLMLPKSLPSTIRHVTNDETGQLSRHRMELQAGK